MNGYVEAGYVVVFATLGSYGASMVARERAAQRRVRKTAAPTSGELVRPDDHPTARRNKTVEGTSSGPPS